MPFDNAPRRDQETRLPDGGRRSRVLLFRIGAVFLFACSVSVTIAGVAEVVLP